MIKDSEHKKALSIIKALIKLYPYDTEFCKNLNGKSCSNCAKIDKAKEYLTKQGIKI